MGERLALAGLNVVYGLAQYPNKGPYLSEVTINEQSDGSLDITVDFDGSFVYDTSEASGFYTCCDVQFADCDIGNGHWHQVRQECSDVEAK